MSEEGRLRAIAQSHDDTADERTAYDLLRRLLWDRLIEAFPSNWDDEEARDLMLGRDYNGVTLTEDEQDLVARIMATE